MLSVLITGCHGLLGQKLVELFSSLPEIDLHGLDIHDHSFFGKLNSFTYYKCNMLESAKLAEVIRKTQPRVIINTAAMTNVDACEAERANCWAINVNAVKSLVKASRAVGAKLVQISTDYVFDGEAGPYSELDRPNPISYYGRSKLASENVIHGAGIDFIIVRTMVLFGHGRNLRTNFVAWLVSRLREGHPVKIVTDQIGNVTLVNDLAHGISRAVEKNVSGVYNMAGKDILSRYDFAKKIADLYKLDASLLHKTLTHLLGQAAPRPLQSGLIVDKAERDLSIRFSATDDALLKYRRQEAMFN